MLHEIQARRSVRKYTDQPVPDELICTQLESARRAPSGSNSQPWHFIVVRNERTKQALAESVHHQMWMRKAPVFLVCVADIRCRLSDGDVVLDEHSPLEDLKWIIRDCAVAIDHILLEAQHIGLSTCWTAWFSQNEIRPILSIPNDKGAESPCERPRRMLKSMVHYEHW